MERDWEIIREIMLKLEALPNNSEVVRLIDFPEEKHFSASYNAQLLVEAGLVEGQIKNHRGIDPKPPEILLRRLTW